MNIIIKNLSKSFGNKKVLDNISLDIKNGEIFGLIGINGAGKTTLIKSILNLINFDNGNIFIDEKNNNSIEAKKEYYYLPEKFTPSPYLKGKEFLKFSLSYYGKKFDRNHANKEAEKLGLLPDVLDIPVSKYSKGMGQKLGLISAFLVDLPLLILDEPMSGLDPIARIKLKKRILEYKETGNTIFFSSHILADIDEICNRIGILHNSKLHFIGTPSDLKKEHENLEVAFLDSISQ